MIGLPTETLEDVEGIAQLAEKVKVSARTVKKDIGELNAILKDYDAAILARTCLLYTSLFHSSIFL